MPRASVSLPSTAASISASAPRPRSGCIRWPAPEQALSGSLDPNACACRRALGASLLFRTKENEWIPREALHRDGNDVAGLAQPCVRVPDLPLTLQIALPQPA